MGQVRSGLRRVAKNWNVENRAQRAIDRPDRAAPPRYPTEEKMIASVMKDSPVPKSQIPGLETEKNPVLDEWLKKVKVYSKDVPLYTQTDGPIEQDPRKGSQEKPLPHERQAPEQDEFGYARPASNLPVPPGRITVRGLLQLLSSYQQDPTIWTIPVISQHFNITEEDATAIIRHFGVFAMHIPQKNEAPKVVDVKAYFKLDGLAIGEFITGKGAKTVELPAFERGPRAHMAVKLARERLEKEDQEERMADVLREAGEEVPVKQEKDEPLHRLFKPVDVEERVRGLVKKKTS